MRFSISQVLALLAALTVTVSSHAAQDSDIRRNLDKDAAAGSSLNQAQTGSVSDENLLRLLENRRDQKNRDDLAGETRDDINSSAMGKTDARKSKASKPTVLVNAEPGDGLVKLSWKLLNVPVASGDQAFRFSIRYGTESEKLSRTLHIGAGDGYVLRELKNNQPYFIQVLATDREQLTLFKSDEIRAVPLPAEDQGSRLEKAFSKKTLTMMDKSELDPFVRELRQFGYDFFKNSSQMLATMDSLPVGNDYILGPGDTLSLNVWGAINSRRELTVDRNGEIMIPNVGMFKVWGLTY